MKYLSVERERSIIGTFQKVCDLLEKENSFLIEGNIEEVIKIFPEKKNVLSILEENISFLEKEKKSSCIEDEEVFSQGIKEVIDIFNNISHKNKILLRQVIETHNSILKIIVIDSNNDNNTRYSSFGEYTKNNNSYSALTLSSDI